MRMHRQHGVAAFRTRLIWLCLGNPEATSITKTPLCIQGLDKFAEYDFTGFL